MEHQPRRPSYDRRYLPSTRKQNMFKSLLQTRGFVVLILLVFLSTGVAAQGVFVKSQAVDRAVIAEMEKLQAVGVAIGIIRNSKVVYTKGYGLANLRTRTPVTRDTIFNWASNSKPLIAIAAMQLVQNAQLDLDTTIGTYISSLPNHLKHITTRQLLCHQSGIPHYTNGEVIPSGKKVSPREELDPLNSLQRFVMSPLVFVPGSKTEYSSYAYVLLTAVVQAAGKKPIDQQLLIRIVKPIGLKTFQLDMPFKRQRSWVTAFKIKNGIPEEVPDYAHFWKHGAGGYKSNVTDFARFAAAVANMELIDEKTTIQMWTPQTTSDGASSIYGLGVVVSSKGQSLKISHNGSQDETRTRMVVYPNQKHGIVVMCNTQGCNPGQISTAIYDAMSKR